jgi:REP element-mobilizing transposase RayT
MPTGARTRGYLPHLEQSGGIYFVTYRLADSLPREFLARLRRERELLENAERAGTRVPADCARQKKLRTLLLKAERLLDRGLGACHMRNPLVARIVADAMLHFRGSRYQLLAWCVMPNHVHAVVSPLGDRRLDAILHSWKSFSAQAANRFLGRSGPFWQREYFDHLVRRDDSLARIVRYVRENPRKAGLRSWPWVGGVIS